MAVLSATIGQIDNLDAAAALKLAKQRAEADGGALWGVSLDGPILLVDPKLRVAIANAPDEGGVLRKSVGIWMGFLPDDVILANTATEWSGVNWSMVLWPLPRNQVSQAQLLMHESFHRIQDELGLPIQPGTCAHMEFAHARYYLRLELQALLAALEAEGDARTEAIRDALLFRAAREDRFPQAAKPERALELNEGLAEYTGLKLSGADEAGILARVRAAIEGVTQRESLARSFAYVSGPPIGLLLDELDLGWRNKLSPEVGPADLLRRAVSYSPPADVAAAAEKAAARYGGAKILAEEEGREKGQERLVHDLGMKFRAGPVLNLRLQNPQYSFDPNKVIPIPGVGEYYESITLTDRWGKLTVDGGGALIYTGFTKMRVVAPKAGGSGTVRGPGWTLELKDRWLVTPVAGTDSFGLGLQANQ